MRLTNEQMREVLAAFCKKNKTQAAAAVKLGISQQYISDMLHQKRDISQEVAEKLGFRRIVVFEEVKP